MTEQTPWSDDSLVDQFTTQSLDHSCPPLRNYLSKGSNVLDVGCGPGPITLDAARLVDPGTVVGVDRAPKMIEQAISSANERGIANATFRLGDAYSLDFANDTFDITYSNLLLGLVVFPLKALSEQERVTKPGGWIIAGIGDHGAVIRYPTCPAYDRVIASRIHLNDPTAPDTFLNPYLGRQAFGLFSDIGLEDLSVELLSHCQYPGSPNWGPARHPPVELDLNGPFAKYFAQTFASGGLDEATVLAAQQEAKDWHQHPHAFHMSTTMFVAGRKP